MPRLWRLSPHRTDDVVNFLRGSLRTFLRLKMSGPWIWPPISRTKSSAKMKIAFLRSRWQGRSPLRWRGAFFSVVFVFGSFCIGQCWVERGKGGGWRRVSLWEKKNDKKKTIVVWSLRITRLDTVVVKLKLCEKHTPSSKNPKTRHLSLSHFTEIRNHEIKKSCAEK